jgi:hypothetical protein
VISNPKEQIVPVFLKRPLQTLVHVCEKVNSCDDQFSLLDVVKNKCAIGSVFDMFLQTNRQRLHPTSYFSVSQSWLPGQLLQQQFSQCCS